MPAGLTAEVARLQEIWSESKGVKTYTGFTVPNRTNECLNKLRLQRRADQNVWPILKWNAPRG